MEILVLKQTKEDAKEDIKLEHHDLAKFEPWLIASQAGLDKRLNDRNVESLIDVKGRSLNEFKLLTPEARYRLGAEKAAQQVDDAFDLRPLTPSDMETLENYVQVASFVKRPDLYAAIDACSVNNDRPAIVLDGPSGVGKTQTALSLTKKKFIYLLLQSADGDRAQKVYKPFHRQSMGLRDCMTKDMAILKTKPYYVEEFDMSSFPEDYEFFTLGYLSQLWLGLDDKKSEVWPLQQANLRIKISPTRITMEKFREMCPNFLLQLDETPFVRFQNAWQSKLKFIRNLIRHVGVVILLGTDSTICNIISNLMTREEHLTKVKDWCHVFVILSHPSIESLEVKMPKLKCVLSQLPQPLRDFSYYVIKTHRPLFVVHFLDALATHDPRKDIVEILDAVCVTLASILVEMKGKSNPLDEHGATKRLFWEIGQRRLPLSIYRIAGRDMVDYLIHGHLAHLSLPNGQKSAMLQLVPGQNGVCLGNEPFKARAVFPSAKDEALLYMALLGCPSVPALRNERGDARISLSSAMMSAVSSTQVSLNNPNAYSSCGDKYEVLLGAGVVLASHQAGIGGQKVEAFLLHFFYEVCNLSFPWTQPSIRLLKKWFGSRKVPYMAPLDSPWPTALSNIPGAVVATPTRPVNSAEHDFRTVFPKANDDNKTVNMKDEFDGPEPTDGVGEDGEEEAEYSPGEEEEEEEGTAEEEEKRPVAPSGEAKNQDSFSLGEVIGKIPDDSEWHILLARNVSKTVRRLTKDKILKKGALLVKLVVKNRAWHLTRYFPDQPRSRSPFKHLVIIVDRTLIAEVTGQDFNDKKVSKRKSED